MTSKFVVTIEHDDNILPKDLEELVEQQTSIYSECYNELNGTIIKVVVEPL